MAQTLSAGARALAALRLEADRIGWPLAYRSDLDVHDARILLDGPAGRDRLAELGFVWILRELGTCLAWGWGEGPRAVLDVFGAPPNRLYRWHRDRLEPVDRDRAERFLRERDRLAGRRDDGQGSSRCA